MKLANVHMTGNEKFIDMVPKMIWNFIANLVTAYFLAVVYLLASTSPYLAGFGIWGGVLCGVLVWIGFLVTTTSIDVIWMGRSFKLWLFEAGCSLIVMAAMGAIIAFGSYSFVGKEIPRNPYADWKTYTNAKYSYQIEYPPDWTYREYPDSPTGAGFRPLSDPDSPDYEFISIDDLSRGTADCGISFSDYVKEAGPDEIENYQSLHSIDPVMTMSGVSGYETTWNIAGPSTTLSLPVTYFADQANSCNDIEIMLKDPDYANIYNQMLTTFQYVSQ